MAAIEWTGRSDWNPVRGCSRENEACTNCYAEIMASRFSDPGLWGHGFAKRVKLRNGKTDHRWTGKVEVQLDRLTIPLGWKKPTFCFVNSTSDIFHPKVPADALDKMFAVMALTPHITYQILTKRPAIMREYASAEGIVRTGAPGRPGQLRKAARDLGLDADLVSRAGWPLPNVWLGTSVHDQASADTFIPELLKTPAAVRFVSYEPALGPVDFENRPVGSTGRVGYLSGKMSTGGSTRSIPALDQIIIGGESGPGSRPFMIEWARQTIEQCQAAGVAVFVKQLGSNPHSRMDSFKLKSKKGGDPAEWPAYLRVRQMPKVNNAEA